MKFIIRLLPTMKSTTCVSCQAGRQMRWEAEEEEEEEKALGSSTKIKVKKKTDIKNHYIHTYKEKVSVAAICQNQYLFLFIYGKYCAIIDLEFEPLPEAAPST